MKICFTSGNPLYAFHIYDYDKDVLISVPTEKHLLVPAYSMTPNYGITWDDTNLYVLCKPRGAIFAYNKEFRFQGPVLGNVDPSTHQILYYDKKMFMVYTNHDYLRIYHMHKERNTYLDLLRHEIVGKPDETRQDIHHFNSVLINNNRLYVLAHNYFEPSFIDVYSYPKLKYLERIPNVGSKSHNIAWWKNDLYTIDSEGSQNIVSITGDSISYGARRKHFAKGLSITDQGIWAGYAPSYEGPEEETALKRLNCDAFIVYFGSNGEYRKKRLKRYGRIHEIRCLDYYDHAHGIKPYLTS